MPHAPSRHAHVDQRFVGRIAGVGTRLAPAAERAAGTPGAATPGADKAGATEPGPRIVVGMWRESPLGSFTDVMVESVSGHRTLLAPSDEVASFVSTTYRFDEVRILPVSWRKIDGGIRVQAEGALDLSLGIGSISALGMLLRAVPSAFATAPAWLRLIDPVARLLVPGSGTAGSAGGGRREYYGVTLARRITSLTGSIDGREVRMLARLDPPVTFGFGSAPATPQLVDVTTTIR